MDKLYDAVIIGAGLSGLSAAYGLGDFKILMLERENFIGGRVLTRKYADIHYDMGAVLGYNPEYLPFDFTPPEAIEEPGPLGLFSGGSMHVGDSVMECISDSLVKDIEKLSAIRKFKGGEVQLETLCQESRDILNAFFQVIHPGEIEDYIPLRQRDAFIRYRPIHYKNGNRSIVNAYLARINAGIETDAEVLSIEKKNTVFRIRFRKKRVITEAQARAIVISTPAPIACDLLSGLKGKSIRFLESIRYGRFTVVAIGTKQVFTDRFSYMVTSKLPINTIYKMTFPESKIEVLLFFYCDRASREINHFPDEEVINQTVNSARRVGLELSKQQIVFTDICRWEHGGTIISQESYATWSTEYLNPSPGIFLAGDYLYGNFPYGMEAAVRSGIEAGHNTREYLRDSQV